MGTKYSTQTISGYNSSPPADDGTQVAANLVTWSGQKTKLADPIKTLAEAIDTALVADLNTSSRAVTTTDNVLAADHKKTLQCSGSFTETLLDAGTAGAGFMVWIKNVGTGVITVDRATASNTVDGFSSVVTLYTLESSLFVVNAAATGYNRIVGGSTPDTSPIVHGATDSTKKVRIEADGLTTATTRVITMSDENFTTPTTGTQASTFTFDGSGGTSGSITMTYQKVGNFVTLQIPITQATSGTSSTVLTANTALPAAIRPASLTQTYANTTIVNNGVTLNSAGVISITSGGIVNIQRDGAGTAFTNTSTCGTALGITITYWVG